MLEPFRMAGLPVACKVGDVKGNVAKGCRLIEEAAKERFRLVCLPERNQRVSFSHE
jgi:predicted amidohydrolase